MDRPLPQEVRLAEMIERLAADRERHLRAMAAIDQVLGQVSDMIGSLQTSPGAGGGMPGGRLSLDADPPRRGRFGRTGERSVLEFIRERGNPATAEINAHWRGEGRRGLVNVTLLRLLKQGRLRRQADSSIRGSRYLLTEATSVT